MDHRQLQDLLESYTLGVLERDERHLVEQHLVGCAECRRLVDDLAATVNLLPLALAAASPQRPPADLKARVLDAVHVPTAASPAAVGAHGDGVASPPAISTPITNGPPARRRTRPEQVGRWRAVATIAAAVVLILSLAWSARLSEALDQERALRERIAAHFSQQQEVVLEVVDADEATRVILRSPDPDCRAYGKLFTRPDLPHVVAMAARLPIPPAGQTYHLWLTSEGRTFLAGVLPVNDNGFGLLTFDADRDGPVYEAAQLTLQPAGAEAPGGETILAWKE